MQAQQQQKGAQGGYGSPLPDLPKQDPMQNTMEWQNHGYGMDSGIQSGATTQAPSVTSAHSHKSHHDDEVLSGSGVYQDWDQGYGQAYTQEQVDGKFPSYQSMFSVR